MLYKRNPQLNKNGELIHLLSIEGLAQGESLTQILDTAANFVSVNATARSRRFPCCVARASSTCSLKTPPAPAPPSTLRLPALSADVYHISTSRRSSASKGRVAARHHRQPVGHGGRHLCGAPQRVGCALPDCPARGPACACGQCRRRSPLPTPPRGCWTCTPSGTTRKTFHGPHRGHRGRCAALARGALGHPRPDHPGLPRGQGGGPQDPGARRHGSDGCAGLPHARRGHSRGADVIIMLRLQNERMSGALLPSSQEFFKSFGLTPEQARNWPRADAIVMHPGPINRGVEIDSAVVDGQSERDLAAGDLWHCGAHGGDESGGGERGLTA